jgi:hypothetical protein
MDSKVVYTHKKDMSTHVVNSLLAIHTASRIGECLVFACKGTAYNVSICLVSINVPDVVPVIDGPKRCLFIFCLDKVFNPSLGLARNDEPRHASSELVAGRRFSYLTKTLQIHWAFGRAQLGMSFHWYVCYGTSTLATICQASSLRARFVGYCSKA